MQQGQVRFGAIYYNPERDGRVEICNQAALNWHSGTVLCRSTVPDGITRVLLTLTRTRPTPGTSRGTYHHHHHHPCVVKEAAKVTLKKKLPESLDWRDQNVVTPVKNQGECGSCWTFASTETLESHWAIAHGSHMLKELSEQFVLDCTPNPGTTFSCNRCCFTCFTCFCCAHSKVKKILFELPNLTPRPPSRSLSLSRSLLPIPPLPRAPPHSRAHTRGINQSTDQCGGTGGCMGGTGELAYAMIKKNGGIPTEWTYPYVSVTGNASTCHGQ